MRNRLTLFFCCTLAACGVRSNSTPTPEVTAAATTVAADSTEPAPRNLILMIGDGMGPQQIGLLQLWATHAETSDIHSGTAFEHIAARGYVGISMVEPADGLVVDSACSATQLATGRPALSEVIGLDDHGERVQTILERAEAAGLATGLVSDTRLTHATPASFAAHEPHRSLENEIAADMLSSGADVLLGGGARHFAAQDVTPGRSAELGAPFPLQSRRADERDLLEQARSDGYALAFTAEQLRQAQVTGGKVLGLFANSSMQDAITEARTREAAAVDPARAPTLREMSLAALDLLDADEDGFFLMIEGGQIDWAGHANDAGWMLHEMRRFEATVAAVLEWMEGRDDTLLVVTADHETGGFAFSYNSYNVPTGVGLASEEFAGRLYKPGMNFGSFDQLDGLFAQSATLFDMFAMAGDEPTAASLMESVNAHSVFDITEEQAARCLATQENPFYVEGHHYLGADTVPHFHDFAAFYPFGSPTGLLARELATQQNVAWATGTHTHTPVGVLAYGPGAAAFGGLLHHVDVGRAMNEALGFTLSDEAP